MTDKAKAHRSSLLGIVLQVLLASLLCRIANSWIQDAWTAQNAVTAVAQQIAVLLIAIAMLAGLLRLTSWAATRIVRQRG